MKLLEHFKELSLYPNNAEELKGLILQLAIQGKLTKGWRVNNPNTEPASELLKRIEAEKQQLIADKKIKKEKPLTTIGEDEIPNELPKGWIAIRLGNIGDWGSGATPSRSRPEFYNGSINWFKSGELNNSEMDYDSSEKITELALQNTSVRLNQPGDVLIAMYGATIGKTGLLRVVGTTNQAVCACTPFSQIDSKYLHLTLKALKDVFLNQGEGGAQPNISRIKIRNQIAFFPPTEEQKAIVEVVNTLFKEVEQLESLTKERIQLKESFVVSALNRLTESENTQDEWNFLKQHFSSFFTEKKNIKSLRETILQLAVQGKLTESWRAMNSNIEPASELLKRIEVEKEKLIAEKKIKKEKPLPPTGNDEMPYEVPDTWVWCRFGKLISFLNGYAFKSSTYVPSSNYQVIRLGNVKNDNFLVNTKEAYVPEIIGDDANGYKLYKDDILTTLTGTKNKRDYCFTCLVKDEHLEERILLLNQRVGCIRAVDKSTSELMNMFLKADTILDQLFATETGTVNQGNIGSTAFKNLVFPLPPIQEQQAIVEKVNSLMVLCDELEQQIESSQTQIEILLQSCLKEVFEYESN